MKRRAHARDDSRQHLTACGQVLILFISLAGLVGCQGLSAGNRTVQTPQGTLSLGSASLDFGKVPAGTNKTLTFTATNTGNASVIINNAAFTTKYFSLSGPSLPMTVGTGQSATITVKFSPNAAGSFAATATVGSDASDGSLPVTLSGTGVADGQLGVNPDAESFGNVPVGNQRSQTVTLTNSGGMSVTVSNAAVSGTGFQLSGMATPLTLTPTQSTTFVVTFAPKAAGATSGNVTITSDASNPSLSLGLSGAGMAPGTVGANPTSLSFGNVQPGGIKVLPETLTNTGGSSLTISAATASGTGFSISGISSPLTLAAGQSTTFNVTFAPQASGNFSGSVAITSDASNPNLSIGLSGTSSTAATLTATPASLTFSNVQVGQNQSLTETIKNTGGTSATISAATASGTGFSISGISTPLTLTAGQSTTFSVTFAPQSSGNFSGSVAITSDASNPNLNITLSGTSSTAATLTATPASLTFNNVQVGQNQSLTETIKNTGGTSATISAATASGSGFSISGISTPLTLGAGQSTSFSVTLSPPFAGSFTGSVAITSDASNPNLSIGLNGTSPAPATLTANPASLTFNAQTGQNQSLTETIKNTGGTSATIATATVSGTGFSIAGITPPVVLAAGQSTTFSVKFTPPSAGSFNGSVSITSDASNPNLSVGLSGTGTAPTPGTLSVSPTTINVSSVVVGNSGTQTGTLSAAGASVTVSSVALGGTNPGEFSISGLSFPVTIAAGQSATFTVTFTPGATGTATATASFASDASNSPTAANLTGTGAAPVVHTVMLTWKASSTTDVTSYNIYRALVSGNACGSFGSPIGSTASTVITFTDNAVTNGDTYCYATSAVDPNGESGLSNVVRTAIP